MLPVLPQRKASFVTITLGLVAISGTAQVANSWLLRTEAEGYSYSATDTHTFGIAAVCELQPQTVSCWRPDGLPDSATAGQLGKLLLATSQSMQMQYRRRNLMLILSGDVMRASAPTFHIRQDGSELMTQSLFTMLLSSGNEQMLGVQFAVNESADICDFVADFRVDLPPQHLSLRGGRFTVGDYTVKYGRFEKTLINTTLGFPGPIDYGVPGTRAGQHYSISPNPIQVGLRFDATYVGKDGKPLTPISKEVVLPNHTKTTRYFDQGTWSTGTTNLGDWLFRGDVNNVAGLEVRPTYSRWVTFRKVRLRALARDF